MARVNLERRAEIGREKRARTRAAILDAARTCFSAAESATVTVDSVTQCAGVAKGTFYLHFADMSELQAELGDALIAELIERLEPARTAVSDPLTRMATGVTLFLGFLAVAPGQARLAAHAIAALPNVGRAVQWRLRDDLAGAQSLGQLRVGSVELAVGLVIGLSEQAARMFGSGRIEASAIPDIVRAILRAVGCTPDEASDVADIAARNAEEFSRAEAT
ncbi:TetR family transcriptional regulator [Gemmobacter aquaticus]|uniref:TetR family transcriptional regulator n=1 Tax=Gemmobacter aquaticus TaxID=490185 RepID=A0A918DB24_9RHOB|nr:TetR family transcriptional regulator [Gemmobacter aquaticus]